MESFYKDLYDLSAWVIPLVLAITLHEAAHGWMAWKLGDDTALRAGRVTFNPLRHIDRFGTVLLPGMLILFKAPFIFGYAKPVPVDFAALRRERRDMALVAFAGPGINLIMAYLAALALNLEQWIPVKEAEWMFLNFYRALQINAVLAIFNLIPLLPLDGGRILYAALPRAFQRVFEKIEPYGVTLLLFLMLLPVALRLDYSIIGHLVEKPVVMVIEAILHLAGIGRGL